VLGLQANGEEMTHGQYRTGRVSVRTGNKAKNIVPKAERLLGGAWVFWWLGFYISHGNN